MAITATSPAFNNGGVGCLATDQRGAARPGLGGCDIGAFELTKASPTIATVATVSVGRQRNQRYGDAHGGNSPTGTSRSLCTPERPATRCLPQFEQPAQRQRRRDVGNSLAPQGVHRWIASYPGDDNNNPVAATATILMRPRPSRSIADDPDDGFGTVVVGNNVSDSATLVGGFNPTGSITFTLYGPNDPTCANAPAFTSAAIPVNGGGPYGSGNFTTSQAGTYLWRASYTGDANNNPVAGACGAANESVEVQKASPDVTTVASPAFGALIGSSLSDTATLAGGFNRPAPSLRPYELIDATCSGAPVLLPR
jgi:hypothetical protein